MADYVTAGQVGSLTHESDATDAWALLVTSASRLFDKKVGVPDDFFAVASSTESNRDFIGNGTAYLKLDPYTSLNAVNPVLINDGTIATPDFTSTNVPDYVVRNGSLVVLDRTTRRPYSPSGIDRFVGWPDGVEIRVSAKWGFTEIPADVTLACAHLATHLWRTADPSFAIISGADGAATRVETIPKIARDIIDEYRMKYNATPVFV